MEFKPGDQVWTHFPGNRVIATVVELGEGEIRVLENGAKKSEWVPSSWCEDYDED